MDSQNCASYTRAQFYAEAAADQRLMWLDFIRGQHNPPGVLKEHVGSIQEYGYKTGVLCGSAPCLYETAAVLVVLDNETKQIKNKNKTNLFCPFFFVPGRCEVLLYILLLCLLVPFSKTLSIAINPSESL